MLKKCEKAPTKQTKTLFKLRFFLLSISPTPMKKKKSSNYFVLWETPGIKEAFQGYKKPRLSRRPPLAAMLAESSASRSALALLLQGGLRLFFLKLTLVGEELREYILKKKKKQRQVESV